MMSIVSATFLADTWPHGLELGTHSPACGSDAAATFTGIQGADNRSLLQPGISSRQCHGFRVGTGIRTPIGITLPTFLRAQAPLPVLPRIIVGSVDMIACPCLIAESPR